MCVWDSGNALFHINLHSLIFSEMKLRAERRIITVLLIILIVNIQVFSCQEDNSSPDKTRDKVRKLSKNKEKLNKFKQIKQANSTSTLDSDDDDTKDTPAYTKSTTATTTRTNVVMKTVKVVRPPMALFRVVEVSKDYSRLRFPQSKTYNIKRRSTHTSQW